MAGDWKNKERIMMSRSFHFWNHSLALPARADSPLFGLFRKLVKIVYDKSHPWNTF